MMSTEERLKLLDDIKKRRESGPKHPMISYICLKCKKGVCLLTDPRHWYFECNQCGASYNGDYLDGYYACLKEMKK
jgi:hypothetical protein